MSMDLQVWSKDGFDLPGLLPEPAAWERTWDEWSFEGDGWQVLVMVSEGEDIPQPVRAKMPSARHGAFITLEPIGAEDDAYAFLEKVVRTLAERSRGVWVDADGTAAFTHDEGQF